MCCSYKCQNSYTHSKHVSVTQQHRCINRILAAELSLLALVSLMFQDIPVTSELHTGEAGVRACVKLRVRPARWKSGLYVQSPLCHTPAALTLGVRAALRRGLGWMEELLLWDKAVLTPKRTASATKVFTGSWSVIKWFKGSFIQSAVWALYKCALGKALLNKSS